MSRRATLFLLAVIALLAATGWVFWGPPEQLPTESTQAVEAEDPGAPDAARQHGTGEEPGSIATATVEDAGTAAGEALRQEGTGVAYRVRGWIEPLADVPLAGARMVAYRGRPGDERLSLSGLFEMSVRTQGEMEFVQDVEGPSIASTELGAGGTFELEVDGAQDIRLLLEHRFYGLQLPLPVHFGPRREVVDLGKVEAICGGYVQGLLISGEGVEDSVWAARGRVVLMPSVDMRSAMRDPMGFVQQSVSATMERTTPLAEDGSFSFSAVRPGSEIRVFWRGEEFNAFAEPFPLRAGESRELRLPVVQAALLHVTVRDADGQPVADARVRASVADATDMTGGLRMGRSGRTEDNGETTIDGLATGEYMVSVEATGMLSARKSLYLRSGEPQETLFELDQGGVVAGIVLDRDGDPVEGAHLLLRESIDIPAVGEFMKDAIHPMVAQAARGSEFLSDAEGRFRITGAFPNTTSVLYAYHPEYVSTIAEDVQPGDEELEIVMRRGARIIGRAVDAATDEPLSTFDARTVAGGFNILDTPTGLDRKTDSEDGRFELPQVAPGTARFELQSPQYSTWSKTLDIGEGEEIDLGDVSMVAAAKVRGVVRSALGEPVAGAVVRRSSGTMMMNNPAMEMFRKVPRVTTDENGRFELGGLATGRTRLLATADGHASGRSGTLRLESGTILEDVEITLGEGGGIDGQVLLPVGATIEEWEAVLSQPPSSSLGSTGLDPDGSFRFDHLDPGNYMVQVMQMEHFEGAVATMQQRTAPGRAPDIATMINNMQEYMVTGKVQVRAGERAELEIDARDLASNEGCMLVCRVEMGGAPLTAGFVEVRSATGQIRTAVVQSGVVRVPGLEPGVTTLQMRTGMTMVPLGAPFRVEIGDAPQQEERWVLPAGRLSGTVVDTSSGDPLGGAMVRLRSDQSDDQTDAGFALTNGAGVFSFDGLNPGRYVLLANDLLDRRDATGRLEVQLGEGEIREGLELRAEPGAGLEVTVSDASGIPIPHAMVLAVTPQGDPLGRVPVAFAGADGRCLLTGLPGGTARIVATKDGKAPGVSSILSLDAGQPQQAQVQLERGTTVTVRVETRDGQPIPNADLRVRWADGPWVPTALLRPQRQADGSLLLGQLPPGTLEFRVRHPRADFSVRKSIPRGRSATLLLSPE